MSRSLRIIAVLATGMILFLTGYAGWRWYQTRWHSSRTVAPFTNLGVPSQPLTVLFMGDDVSYKQEGKRQVADRQSFYGRTDTMLVVRLDPLNQSITGIQIPRDTLAEIPGSGTQKINSANAIGGSFLSQQTVERLLGIPMDRCVMLNLQGFVDVVNEVGGVTVQVPAPMHYMDWTAKLKIDLQPGPHTLTGNQSMGFVRFRHDALGDIGRIQRQQVFMRAFCDKLLSPPTWAHIPRLMQIAHDNIATNMSQLEMLQCFNLVRNAPKKQMHFVMLPGRFGPGGTWIADSGAISELMLRIAGGRMIARDRQDLTVAVRNISSTPDLGWKIGELLRKNGYSVVLLSDQQEESARTAGTRIIAQRGNVEDAQLVQHDLGCGDIINASIGDIYSAITVLVGDDAAMKLGPAPPVTY